MLHLVPCLGDFIRLEEGSLFQSGMGNSTRWIIDVLQNVPAEGHCVSTRFQLLRNGRNVFTDAFSFSFGALSPGMYLAAPWLEHERGVFTLRAKVADARYRLSIDILHSLYR